MCNKSKGYENTQFISFFATFPHSKKVKKLLIKTGTEVEDTQTLLKNIRNATKKFYKTVKMLQKRKMSQNCIKLKLSNIGKTIKMFIKTTTLPKR